MVRSYGNIRLMRRERSFMGLSNPEDFFHIMEGISGISPNPIGRDMLVEEKGENVCGGFKISNWEI